VKNLMMLLLFLGLTSAAAAPAFADSVPVTPVTVSEGTSQLLGRVLQPGAVGLCDILPQDGCPVGSRSDFVIWIAVLDDSGKQVDTRVAMCSDPDNSSDSSDSFLAECNTTINPSVILQEAGVENGIESTPWNPGSTDPGGAPAGTPAASYNLISDTTPVPEPSSMLMLGSGLLGVVAALRRKRLG
jgi:hypothetical protein